MEGKTVIEHRNSSDSPIFRYGESALGGATLLVAENQQAVIVKGKEVKSVLPTGMYTLGADGLPILSSDTQAVSASGGGEPAVAYFVSEGETSFKWGTAEPIKPTGIGSAATNGFYGRGRISVKATDAAAFVLECEKRSISDRPGVAGFLREVVFAMLKRILDACVCGGIPVDKLASFSEKIGDIVCERVGDELKGSGLTVTDFRLESLEPAAGEQAAARETTPRENVREHNMPTEQRVGERVAMTAKSSEPVAITQKNVGEIQKTADHAVAETKPQMSEATAPRPSVRLQPMTAAASGGDGTCPECGAKLTAGARFCSECGAKIPVKRFCQNCGTELEGNAKFCPMCGFRQDK
ncbi:MAG TPA: hypothetical protein DIV38_01645 [Clostridiales bacterium]|nr:hypothetical protein [Clostridiales bacterium]